VAAAGPGDALSAGDAAAAPAPAQAPAQVQHDAAASRFWLEVDGQRCVLDYRQRGAVVHLVHTGVPPAVAGRGIAARLVVAALAWVEAQGLKAVPDCSYVATWMDRHPASAHLRA
jgi:predicted GNAT family acetyltransferase